MKSHSIGCHVLSIGVERLGRHLRCCHGDLVHLGSRRVRVGQSRTAAGLVWRVGERGKRASSVGAVELRAHVRTGARLVGSRTEVGTRRVRHLALVARLGVSATTATLVRIAATARTGGCAHITMRRLGRFATEMGGLGTGTKGCLGSRTNLLAGSKIRFKISKH